MKALTEDNTNNYNCTSLATWDTGGNSYLHCMVEAQWNHRKRKWKHYFNIKAHLMTIKWILLNQRNSMDMVWTQLLLVSCVYDVKYDVAASSLWIYSLTHPPTLVSISLYLLEIELCCGTVSAEIHCQLMGIFRCNVAIHGHHSMQLGNLCTC